MSGPTIPELLLQRARLFARACRPAPPEAECDDPDYGFDEVASSEEFAAARVAAQRKEDAEVASLVGGDE